MLKRKTPADEDYDAATEDPSNRFVRASNRSFKGLNYEQEGRWSGDFAFVQLADPQLGMLNMNNGWEEEEKMLEVCVNHINRLQPKFVVVCGDLVNAYPDTQTATQELQIRDFKRICSGIDPHIPLVCLCGNHDVGDRPTVKTLATYGKHFGDDYFSFWVGGVRFLALNTQLYRDWGERGSIASPETREKAAAFAAGKGEPDIDESLITAHEEWLNAELEFEVPARVVGTGSSSTTSSSSSSSSASSSSSSETVEHRQSSFSEFTQTSVGFGVEKTSGVVNKGNHKPPRTIALSHIPPFIEDPDEADGYFNIAKVVREPLLRKLHRGGCESWFCGHYHRNARGYYRRRQHEKWLEVVTSSAVGCILLPSGIDPLGLKGFKIEPGVSPAVTLDQSGMRIVRVSEQDITHEWFTFDSVPQSLNVGESAAAASSSPTSQIDAPVELPPASKSRKVEAK